MAYDRGLIKDVRRRVGEDVPIEQFRSEHDAKITWDDLLRQTSDWEGTLWGKPDCRKLMPSAPESSFVHLGAGTNMIYVDPENDLVVVARWIDRAAMDGLVQGVLAARGP